jgi:hypothetical protein
MLLNFLQTYAIILCGMKRHTKNNPRIRMWGKSSRKVMTQIIPSKKDKLKKRGKMKKMLVEELKEE